jgi:hypothetical protein
MSQSVQLQREKTATMGCFVYLIVAILIIAAKAAAKYL